MSDDQLRDRVSDPSTSAAELAQIAAARPDLHAAIAVHPNAYPALLSWLVDQGDPAVASAVAARGGLPAGPDPVASGGEASATSAPSRTGLIIGLVVGGVVLLGVIGAVVAGLFVWRAGSAAVDAVRDGASSVLAELPGQGSTGESLPGDPSVPSDPGTDGTGDFCTAFAQLGDLASSLDPSDPTSVEEAIAAYQRLADLAPSEESRAAYQDFVDVLSAVVDGDSSAYSRFSDVFESLSTAVARDAQSC